MSEFPIIDAHAMLGEEYHLRLEADELMRCMDAAGIATAIARPVGAELAVCNSAGNGRVLNAGGRVRAMVSASPWLGAAALDELRRCRDRGAVGLLLHPARQGFMPTDDMVRPLLDFAAEAGWPVMFHTGTYIHADILAVGIVARQYPQINFIAGFGGFTDMWFELPGVFAATPNLYLDASMIWGDAVLEIGGQCGFERVLFGGALPRSCYAVALRTLERLDLDGAARRLILHDNARRLFNLS